jgi:hypothetical protein
MTKALTGSMMELAGQDTTVPGNVAVVGFNDLNLAAHSGIDHRTLAN